MESGENQIDFTPLKHYSSIFQFLRIIRRVKMVLVRLLVLGLIVTIFGFSLYILGVFDQSTDSALYGGGNEYLYSSTSLESIDLGFWFNLMLCMSFALFIGLVFSMMYMGTSWEAFASKNGFRVIRYDEEAAIGAKLVPSFRGKLLSLSLGTIVGVYRDVHFAFFARQYKEGGILRWRERQMDTILMFSVQANLPHIVVDARGNEQARRSNLSGSYPDKHKFQFEGVHGSNYNVYAEPSSRILALQLFTPDVLTVLYEKLPTADIEIQGNKIWIVQRYGLLDDKLAKEMFEASHDLYSELTKQMKSAQLLIS